MNFLRENRNKVLYILGLVLFLLVMVIITVLFTPSITELIIDPQSFRTFIDSYGSLSILVFIGIQILQVVIAAIPGEFVQIAGGYIFGTFLGTVYSTIGILIGACIAFFMAKILGIKIIRKLLSVKNVKRFEFIINSRKSEIVIFLLFLIPGLPKDILVYIAGLSPIRSLRFFFIFISARLPGLIGSSIIGANLQDRNYTVAIIVFVISCILFVTGLTAQEFIMKKLKVYHHAETQD